MTLKYLANIRIPTERAHGYAIMKMCEQFSDAGFKAELIIPGKRNNIIGSEPFAYYHVKNNFSLVRIGGCDFLGLTERFGFLFYYLDLVSFLVLLFSKKVIAATDIIYTRDFMLLLPFSRRYSNICLEVHELPNSLKLFKCQATKAKKIIALNLLLKDELVSLGLAADRIMVFGDAVDLEDFRNNPPKTEARAGLSLPNDKKIVLYAGHFYQWKGVDVLAEAAKTLPELLFIFIGGVAADLQRFKEKFSEDSNIKTIPFQKHAAIPAYLAAADVLVLPNSAKAVISSNYTSPLKLFEYMAAKRPIVASDLPSLREILNASNSILVRPDDPVALVAGIRRALSGDIAIDRMIEQAYKDVQSHTWRNRAGRIKEFISS